MKHTLHDRIRAAEPCLPRFLTVLCVLVLLAALTAGILPAEESAGLYDRFVRLHVLAASDSEDDQALKLRVRDAVIGTLSGRFDGITDTDIAEKICLDAIPELEDAAREVILSAGYTYDCRVTLTRETYPDRTYGSCTLPAGEYRSLRVLIGPADGHNWWCVLFPPLCTGLAAEKTGQQVSARDTAEEDDGEELLLAAGFTPKEITILTNGEMSPAAPRRVVVKFRIVEWIKTLLSRKMK